MKGRRPALGEDPFDAVVPPPRAAPPPAARTAQKTRVSYDLPVELVDRVRAATVALSGPPERLTLAGLVERALEAEVERLEREHNKGKPFPKPAERLRGGRPIGS
jgi:hypothetical protein